MSHHVIDLFLPDQIGDLPTLCKECFLFTFDHFRLHISIKRNVLKLSVTQ